MAYLPEHSCLAGGPTLSSIGFRSEFLGKRCFLNLCLESFGQLLDCFSGRHLVSSSHPSVSRPSAVGLNFSEFSFFLFFSFFSFFSGALFLLLFGLALWDYCSWCGRLYKGR